MTATAVERLTEFAGLVPGKGTFGMAANTLVLKKTLVCLDAAGRAVPAVDGEGLHAVGAATSTIDNRTGSPAGGLADDIDLEVEYGVFEWLVDGTSPQSGNLVFAVDNQTVSVDSDGGARGIAGVVTEVRTVNSVVRAYVYSSPLVPVMAGVVSGGRGFLPLDITTWTDGGAPLIAFADGTANGLALVDSEAIGFRHNPVGEDTSSLARSVAMPKDIDTSEDLEVHVSCFRVGSADTTAVLVGNAFFHTPGAAHTADADAITANSAAIAAATTIVQELVLTIAAADVPADAVSLTLTLAPDAALDADDLVITAIWLEYAKA